MIEIGVDREGVNESEGIQTCERCSHYSICFIRLNIADFIEQRFTIKKPFEASDLAKICKEYDPVMRVVFER